jgi:hypothetical protein
MWPFHNRKERARRKVLLPFARYLSPEVIEALVSTPDALLPELQQAAIPYIILQVRDDDLAQVPDYLDRASGAVLDAGGTILSVMSSVMAVAFGIPVRAPELDGVARRDQAVARLRSDLGSNVRAIFGRADGLYGTIGTQRMTYGALLPGFGGSLERLLRLEFGSLAEA